MSAVSDSLVVSSMLLTTVITFCSYTRGQFIGKVPQDIPSLAMASVRNGFCIWHSCAFLAHTYHTYSPFFSFVS